MSIEEVYDFPKLADGHFGEIRWSGYLGRGSMGNVFHGQLIRSTKAVAVKQIFGDINPRICREELCRWRFLQHPNVLKFYDYRLETSANETRLYMLLEYASKGPLRDYLSNVGYVSEKDFARWSLQIATGLRYLHDNNIIHRHLKSSNVLLDENYNVKISDFGYEFIRRTSFQGVLSEVSWTAPEIVKGPRSVEEISTGCDVNGDIFSLGMILWEMITCEQPFKEKDNQYQILWAVCERGGRPRIPTCCPQGVAKLIEDCWHQDSTKRPTVADIIWRLKSLELPLNNISKS